MVAGRVAVVAIAAPTVVAAPVAVVTEDDTAAAVVVAAEAEAAATTVVAVATAGEDADVGVVAVAEAAVATEVVAEDMAAIVRRHIEEAATITTARIRRVERAPELGLATHALSVGMGKNYTLSESPSACCFQLVIIPRFFCLSKNGNLNFG